jgi:hypothetical protein
MQLPSNDFNSFEISLSFMAFDAACSKKSPHSAGLSIIEQFINASRAEASSILHCSWCL